MTDAALCSNGSFQHFVYSRPTNNGVPKAATALFGKANLFQAGFA